VEAHRSHGMYVIGGSSLRWDVVHHCVLGSRVDNYYVSIGRLLQDWMYAGYQRLVRRGMVMVEEGRTGGHSFVILVVDFLGFGYEAQVFGRLRLLGIVRRRCMGAGYNEEHLGCFLVLVFELGDGAAHFYCHCRVGFYCVGCCWDCYCDYCDC
jgi:hypothetical protein